MFTVLSEALALMLLYYMNSVLVMSVEGVLELKWSAFKSSISSI